MATRLAVILAAGTGSRLRPLTDDRPKPLVPLGSGTILSRAVDALVGAGVSRLVVATGYKEHALRHALAESSLEVTFCPNPDYAATQNSVSLALCRDAVGGDSFFRLDGDVVFDAEILSRLNSSSAYISAAVDRERKLDDEAMKVRLERGSQDIAAFGKGIPLSESGGESIGIERIDSSACEELFDALDGARAAGDTHLYYEDVYSRLILRGARVRAVDITGLRWCEVDSLEDLDQARELFSH